MATKQVIELHLLQSRAGLPTLALPGPMTRGRGPIVLSHTRHEHKTHTRILHAQKHTFTQQETHSLPPHPVACERTRPPMDSCQGSHPSVMI